MNRDFSINPTTAEDIADCATIEGMRKRIQQYRRHDSVTRAICDSAYHRGLSGEDTMTWLAFEALRRVEHMEKLLLEHHMTTFPPLIIAPGEACVIGSRRI